jgi:hypothetical protein
MVLRLVQALLGAVSANFRMVALSRNGDIWKLSFVLESEDAADREEINDIVSEFDALQDHFVEHEVEIVVSAQPIPWPEPPARVIFRRREV